MADNYGRKPMLLRAMFGGAVIIFLQGLVTAPWQLLVLRVIQGVLQREAFWSAAVLCRFLAPAKVH